MKRRDARESAFQLIFEKSFQKESMQELLDQAIVWRALEVDDYARRLVLLTEEHCEELDAGIESFLTGWKLSRLPRVTLMVLRLSFCELLYFPDIPVRVSINEAVELAKKYATEEDASYINGVLGTFVRKTPLQKNEETAQPEEEAAVKEAE